MKRRLIKRGEALAVLAEAVHASPEGIWWDQGSSVPPNERCGDVAVVHIRGSLEHHAGYGTDCYDQIAKRVECALAGADENGEDAGGVPRAVVVRIDSPGGVVSGLNETVFAIRKMSEESGVPLVAYVDELAASAAYALACACDTIVLPASAICGSVGVISCMFDQVKADEMMGVNFVTLTSGARKSDGHPHVAISEDALAAEQHRVDRLARQFYRLVADVRPLSPKKAKALEAGIFLAGEAVEVGLADEVCGWDALVSALNDSAGVNAKPVDALRQSLSSTRIEPGAIGAAKETSPMSLAAFAALVKRTKAALAAESDPSKKKALKLNLSKYEAALEAYKKEKHTVEKHETEEGDEEDEAEDEAAEEEEEAKGNETDRKEDGGDDSDDDEEEDEDDEEEDDEEDEAAAKKAAASLASLARQVTGKKGRAAVGALAAVLEQGKRSAAIVDQIQKERRAEKKAAAIASALNARRITRHEARTLAGKPLGFVRSFLEMRPKAIINVDDDTIRIPDPSAAASDVSALPANVIQQIDAACMAAPDADSRKALRAKMIGEHTKRQNGVSGRL